MKPHDPHRPRPPLAVKLRLHKLLTFIGSHCPHGWVEGIQRHNRYSDSRKAHREVITLWLKENLSAEEIDFLNRNSHWLEECIG